MVDPPIPFDPPENATRDELRNRLRSLAALVERAPVPIAVAHDEHGHFISANTALARLLGVRPGVNISLTPADGDPPYRIQRGGRDIPNDDLPMQFAMARSSHVTNDIEIIRSDGTVLFVQNDVEPLYDAAGAVCGCVSVCVDLTDRKRAEDLLREADRRKDEFLATLSHELRNPLAPIRNALELLRRGTEDPVMTERALAVMERQFQQLVRLTDDLLDVSRITRNRIELRRKRLDLRDVLHSAIETNQPLIDAANHTLVVQIADAPVWLDGDFTRLAQAFGNLLNNATKYTDRGGTITVTVSAAGTDATVSIADNGIGIEGDRLAHIFEMFVQLDASSDPARGGLGIGLTLAKRLIELHGGRLDASSGGANQGTTFTATLPLQAATLMTTDAAEPTHTPVLACRVLVAEDIPDAAEMLRMMLEVMGHAVRVAADGIEAISVAQTFLPQVVLLDIGMPRMDGYEAARRIRAALGSKVLLVALTGWGQESDKRRAIDAGFDCHLTKPAEPDELERLIASVLERS